MNKRVKENIKHYSVDIRKLAEIIVNKEIKNLYENTKICSFVLYIISNLLYLDVLTYLIRNLKKKRKKLNTKKILDKINKETLYIRKKLYQKWKNNSLYELYVKVKNDNPKKEYYKQYNKLLLEFINSYINYNPKDEKYIKQDLWL